MMRRKIALLQTALLTGAILIPGPALAELRFGPVDQDGNAILHPTNNFPIYYQDDTNTTLELCLDGDGVNGLCIFDPPIAGNAYSQTIGFGAEAFWFLAEASVAITPTNQCTTCSQGMVTLAVEAAFNQELPVKGDEFMFGRVRIRIDAPHRGWYKVTHPYGSHDFYVATPGRRAINETIDIGTMGPDPSGPRKSLITQFLKWDPAVAPAAPAGYIGDPQVPHRVVGSPEGNNFFRIEHLGDDLPGDPTPKVLANNQTAVTQNEFTVMGKRFTGTAPTPLTFDRASYKQDAQRIEIFARSTPTATLNVNIDGNASAMAGDGKGNFWYSGAANVMPSGAEVTATDTGSTPGRARKLVTDTVTISGADYYPNGKVLCVAAQTSVQDASLVIKGYEEQTRNFNMTSNFARIENVLVPPADVEVRSSKGGVAKRIVTAHGTSAGTGTAPPTDCAPTGGTPGGDPPVTGPTAVNESVQTAPGTPVTINVAANDTPSTGASFTNATITITAPPQKGSHSVGANGVTYTPNSTFTSGSDTFRYRITDSLGRQSNEATVTITIQAEQLLATQSTYATSTNRWTVAGSSNLVGGNTISAYYVNGTTEQLIGSASVGANGSFSITATGPIPQRTSTAIIGSITLRSSKGTVKTGVPISATR